MFPVIVNKRGYSDLEFGASKPKTPKPKKPKNPPKAKPKTTPKKSVLSKITSIFNKPKTPTKLGTTTGGIVYKPLPDNSVPPVRNVLSSVAQTPQTQGWFRTLIDAGLTLQSIKSQTEIAKAQAGLDQTAALQQLALAYEPRNSNPNPFQGGSNFAGNSVGGQTGSALDNGLQWVSDNILVVGGVGLGLYLLTRPSPIKGR